MDDEEIRARVTELKAEFSRAYDLWLHVPGGLFAIARAEADVPRPEIAALLERAWFKLSQDLSGVLALVASNHLGPAKALIRICREASLQILTWSLSGAAMDSAHVRYMTVIRPHENAHRLKRDVGAFLNNPALQLDPRIVRQLQNAVAYADHELARDASTQPESKELVGVPRGFRGTVKLVTENLLPAGLHHVIPAQIIDYWIESEVVHTGVNCVHLYEPERFGLGLELDGELTCLSRLRELWLMKPMVTHAIMEVFNLRRRIPEPHSSVAVDKLGNVVERVVVAATQSIQELRAILEELAQAERA